MGCLLHIYTSDFWAVCSWRVFAMRTCRKDNVGRARSRNMRWPRRSAAGCACASGVRTARYLRLFLIHHISYAAMAIFLIAMTIAAAANADETWDGIRITCLQDFGYLDIETMTAPLSWSGQKQADEPQIVNKITKIHEIYTPQSLIKNPYICNIDNTIFSIEVTNFIASHYPGGECSDLDHFTILIRLDGASVYSFPAFGINRCANQERHFVDINFLNHLRDCTIADIGKSSCVVKNFKKIH